MTDHIIHNSDTQQAECLHCKTTMALKMPIKLDDMITQMDTFIEAHKDCKPEVQHG